MPNYANEKSIEKLKGRTTGWLRDEETGAYTYIREPEELGGKREMVTASGVLAETPPDIIPMEERGKYGLPTTYGQTMRPPVSNEGMQTLRPAVGVEIGVPREQAYEMVKRLQEAGRGEEGPIYEYYPTETAGVPDLKSIAFRHAAGEDVSELNNQLDELVEANHAAAIAAAKRQLFENTKIAEDAKDVSPAFSQILLDEANATYRAQVAKYDAKRDYTENVFKRVGDNVNASPAEELEFKMGFVKKNPVWKTPAIKRPAMPKEKPLSVDELAESLGIGEEKITPLPKKPIRGGPMQIAPNTKLNPYWNKLTEGDKELVWAAFNRNVPVETIIESLKARGYK